MRYSKTLSACLLLASSAMTQAAVTVTGDVKNAGSFAFVPGARLLDAVSQGSPNAESYWLAAAWLHQPLVEQQIRLKAGVLFDLKLLQRGALLEEKAALRPWLRACLRRSADCPLPAADSRCSTPWPWRLRSPAITRSVTATG